MKAVDIERIVTEVGVIGTPETRVFAAGVSVFPVVFGIMSEVARENKLTAAEVVVMKYGLKYLGVYILNSVQVRPYEIVEVLNPDMKQAIIDGMEKFK